MRILLTNDDGIHAEGLVVLERIARTLSDDVWVVAPETDQSGYAHSLSISEPLRLRKVADKKFAVRGTPTDCVIMGVKHVLPGAPDLILSGVNSGANVADDITYSGTVAGAMEGTLLGIRSIALSQAYRYDGDDRFVPYETTEALAPALMKKLVAMPLPQGVLLNVNFPNCAPGEVAGTVVATQGKMAHALWIDQRRDFGKQPVGLFSGLRADQVPRAVDGAGMAEIGGQRVEAHQRMRRPERQQHAAGARKLQHLAPCSGRFVDQVRPPGLHLRRRVDGKCPLPALPRIARIGFSDAGGGQRGELGLSTRHVKRRQAVFGGDLADMRVIDDDQVIGAGEFFHRKGFKILKRALFPGNRNAGLLCP